MEDVHCFWCIDHSRLEDVHPTGWNHSHKTWLISIWGDGNTNWRCWKNIWIWNWQCSSSCVCVKGSWGGAGFGDHILCVRVCMVRGVCVCVLRAGIFSSQRTSASGQSPLPISVIIFSPNGCCWCISTKFSFTSFLLLSSKNDTIQFLTSEWQPNTFFLQIEYLKFQIWIAVPVEDLFRLILWMGLCCLCSALTPRSWIKSVLWLGRRGSGDGQNHTVKISELVVSKLAEENLLQKFILVVFQSCLVLESAVRFRKAWRNCILRCLSVCLSVCWPPNLQESFAVFFSVPVPNQLMSPRKRIRYSSKHRVVLNSNGPKYAHTLTHTHIHTHTHATRPSVGS